MFNINYSENSIKMLRRIPKNISENIIEKINNLAVDPDIPNNNVTKLKGIEAFRLRVGDWRVIYEIDRQNKLIIIINIAARGNAYS